MQTPNRQKLPEKNEPEGSRESEETETYQWIADTQNTPCEMFENVTSGHRAALEDYKQTTAEKSQLRQMKNRWKTI